MHPIKYTLVVADAHIKNMQKVIKRRL